EPSASALEILKFVADNIQDMPNKIAVEGHTDATPLKTTKFSNWELSTERASAARRIMQDDGIKSDRIARVVGYADTELLYKDKPTDSRNRRISIILLEEKVAQPPIAVEPAQGKAAEAPQPLQKASTTANTPAASTTPAPKPSTRQEQNKSFIVPIEPKKPLELNKPDSNR